MPNLLANPRILDQVLWFEPSDGTTGWVAKRDLDFQEYICEVDSLDRQLLARCDGCTPAEAIGAELETESTNLEARFDRLRPFLRWIEPDPDDEARRSRMFAAALNLRNAHLAATADSGANTEFHAGGIADAQHQFDEVETTVSHLFRKPQPALGGRTYGQAFADWLLDADFLSRSCRILEVGCGVGWFAANLLGRILEREPDIYQSLHYTMFDLSPTLQQSQREHCSTHAERVKFQLGSIESHDFASEKFDLILSNEVIADLNVGTVRPGSEAEELATRYDLDTAAVYQGDDAAGVINVGAIWMLENAYNALAPSGRLVVTEYGDLDSAPRAVGFQDHFEYTIHFGHLRQVAEKLGLSPELVNLGEILKFDGEFRMLDLLCLDTLNHVLLPALGRTPIEKKPYDDKQLQSALGDTGGQIHNLKFAPLRKSTDLSPFRFHVLTGAKSGPN